MSYRVEEDPLGKKKVPMKAFYGIHTQRAKENFKISGKTLDKDIFYTIADIKRAAAQANKELKLLDARKAKAISRAAREVKTGKLDEYLVIDAYQAGAGTPTHMNVNEVIANQAILFLGGKLGGYHLVHPNDDVNKGQSTNNVIPTAVRILSVQKLNKLLITLRSLEKELKKKSTAFKKIIKSGRTHYQDAVLITLGQEFHAYATAVTESIQRIKEVIPRLCYLNIGKNAIGTGVNTPKKFSRLIIKSLKETYSSPFKEAPDPIYATSNYSDFLETSQKLSLLATNLIKICNDLQFMNSGPHTGIQELHLPAVEAGSSIMPGKVNPSMVEMLLMVCYQVLGNHETIRLAVQSGHMELNVNMPLIGKNMLENMDLLHHAIESFTLRCVKGIKANKDVCAQYTQYSAGIGTLLNPYVGYNRAAEIVKESVKTGKPVKEVVLKKGLLSKEEIKKIFG